jgi:hypothetical protein
MRRLGGVLTRHRTTVLVVAAALVAVLGTAWLGRSSTLHTAALDPQNPGGTGAQALARVLGREGVEVDIVRSAAALDSAGADASTTIVVTSAGNLGRSTTSRLLADQGQAQLVVVDPGPELVRELRSRAFPLTSTPAGAVPAGCPTYDGLALQVDHAHSYRGPGCFRAAGRTLLARPRVGLTFFGAAAALTNDQILDGDNAAVSLRLLGQRARLVWYVPSLADLAGGDSVSASSLLPDWLVPALWMTGVAGVGLIVWRARRLGPLAKEPLPVEVKAIETTRNLGRLYRRAGDRTHAANALRSAARVRLTDHLGMPPHASVDDLTTAVAARTGRAPSDLAVLLREGSLPPDDAVLAELAHQLAELDREVSRP